MLALVLTLILALYILGPDLFSKWVVGFFAPARVQNRSRSEEISKALFGSVLPFSIAFVFLRYGLHHFRNLVVLRNFVAGAYSEKAFDTSPDVFFASVWSVIRANRLLLLLIYGMELVWSVGLVWLIKNYGRILRHLEKHRYVRNLVVYLVRPWTAEWHLKLSGMLLERKTDYIQVDVMTKLNILYRGRLTDYDLAPDGLLVSLTLQNPKKFKREELLEARKNNPLVSTSTFWTAIEGKVFVMMASEIVTLNLNYIAQRPFEKGSITKQAANEVLTKVRARRVKYPQ